MTDTISSDFRHPRRHVRLDTILRLRWLAALGQIAAIFVVAQGLEFEFPVIPCIAVVGLSALVNIALQAAFNPMQRMEPIHAAALLALNIAELAGLLFLTGGLQNPFSFLFLGPVLIAATALPTRMTIGLGIFAALCAALLGYYHLPLPWNGDEPVALPSVYLFGVWLSILLAIGVTSLYTFQVTEEARKLADALAATELVLTREQHLTQIDGLAAAAAHELGTPLSTIFLIARELEKTSTDATIAGDLKVLREQAQRCREILSKITQLSSSGAPFDRMPLSTLIEEAVAPHRDFDITIKVRIAVAGVPEPVGMRNPAILYGVGNILENAVDFARNIVEVNAWWNADTVQVMISDDGPGIAPDMLRRIGEPYVSRRRNADDPHGAHAGLGLGVFIARTLLERTGAKVSFRNKVFPDHGAVVQITWPRSRFETVEIPQEPDT
ncbi:MULTISPECIES: ActS/PrrB/RegB family redox-sensitive histidine kinase [Rhodopseudomonas]|uniref:histidine kinase n=1 Tax=Rhodopseudomonas palustris TaxID=1076 RepID=A0A0D7EY69_RHOPL|nr:MULTISPECIES: ActS/PrrB/RegB family redox-sensitive histidine kinase [Rhodopseudomonas]KIZ45576.1 ATPase [Rhodopseudomonas palustris]MDF3808996.1 ActS/PrrB/RegB family redox-sensitive histidine kinase [Rhodopseudomonas sp. BAL398]WOK16850.1 ActS/PrrB/RegB family redox-sensitive histidine kinase [Rhodopseudomonas sp. BAL398]